MHCGASEPPAREDCLSHRAVSFCELDLDTTELVAIYCVDSTAVWHTRLALNAAGCDLALLEDLGLGLPLDNHVVLNFGHLHKDIDQQVRESSATI